MMRSAHAIAKNAVVHVTAFAFVKALPMRLRMVLKRLVPPYRSVLTNTLTSSKKSQNWCGCRISAAEAAAEREERKAARAAARAAHAAEHAAERAEEQAAQMARKAQRAAYDKKQQRKREILKQIRLANKAQEQSEAEPTPRTHN